MAKKRKAKQETAMQIRVTTELRKLLQQAADKDNRSLSNWVRDRLERIARKELGKQQSGS